MTQVAFFNNTEEAIRFGQKMNPRMLPILKEFQMIYYNISKNLLKKKRYQEAGDMGFKSQLYREAIEAFNGTLKLRGQK